MVDFISALSRASPTEPMEPAMPASVSASVKAREVYCLGPGVGVMDQPGRGEGGPAQPAPRASVAR